MSVQKNNEDGLVQKKPVKHRKPVRELTMTISMTIPRIDVERIDNYIKEVNQNRGPLMIAMNRSEFFRTAAAFYLDSMSSSGEETVSTEELDAAVEDDILERFEADKNYGLL